MTAPGHATFPFPPFPLSILPSFRPPAMTYAEAVAFLFPRTTTIKFGLATTRALLKELERRDVLKK